jgi:hypothetical protein
LSKVKFLSSIGIVRIALALTVALWMAGAGCLLGCENMVSAAGSNNGAAAPGSLTIVAAGDVCSSAHSKDCCARHGSKVGARPAAKSSTSATVGALLPEVGAVPSSMMDSCPLAVNATAALSKAKQDQSSSVLPANPATAVPSNTPGQTIALSNRPQLANRGPTYLHCCVFLI